MKLDQWMQPGQLSLMLPTTWEVRELNEVTELVPSRGDAAVEISVLKKSRSSVPTKDEAARLVEHFAKQNHLSHQGEAPCYPREFGWQCIGQFVSGNDASVPRFWLVSAITRESRASIASLCSDDIHGASFAEGADILKSIELLP